MEQDPDAEFGDVQDAALSRFVDGVAVHTAVSDPAGGLAWYSTTELHPGPPPRRVRHPWNPTT